MSSANCGWLFYKKPFLGNNLNFEDANKKLLESNYANYAYPTATHNSIKLKTIYPGLVIGSGYMHSMSNQAENFDFGFYFDYTTGMPVIPGSSVKGVLRSLFGQNKNDRYKEQKEALIRDFANNDSLNVKALFNEIFEGIDTNDNAIPMHKRDKFFDAFISSGDRENKIFEDDYITPHSNPLRDPDPNRMLKVRPDVEFTFIFELYDFCDEDGKIILSAEQKEELFLQLLLFNGVGAKTNVGYGQFEEISVEKFKETKRIKATLNDIANESPIDKIIKEYKTIADIVSAYNQGLSERVIEYKDEFKDEILKQLNIELQSITNKKKQEKVNKRIEKVQTW